MPSLRLEAIFIASVRRSSSARHSRRAKPKWRHDFFGTRAVRPRAPPRASRSKQSEDAELKQIAAAYSIYSISVAPRKASHIDIDIDIDIDVIY